MITKLTTSKIKVNLGFLSLEGIWEIDEKQRSAAWELYVELITRITMTELHEYQGNLREALTSYYSLFDITREILKKYGPSIASAANPNDITLGHISVSVLNEILRPILSKWHPALINWEAQKPNHISVTEHERLWQFNVEIRSEINQTRKKLLEYADVLSIVSNVSQLHKKNNSVS